MVQIIAGRMGNGKTKFLLDKANESVKDCKGSIVYLDKNTKNMHALDNRIRLINVCDYPVRSYNAFIGFLCGIISQDYDLEYVFLDSFLKLAHLEGLDISAALIEIDQIGQQYGVTFVLSIAMDAEDLPEYAKSRVVIAL